MKHLRLAILLGIGSAFGACGGDTTTDSSDLGAQSGDLSVQAGDMKPGSGCTTIGAWVTTSTVATLTLDPFTGYDAETIVYGYRMANALPDTLGVAVWRPAGASITYPKTYTLSATGSFGTCEQCVFADIGITGSAPATRYFARGGSLTVTAADTKPSGGSIKVNGTALHLIEWDNATDKAVPNAKCIDVGIFDFQATYPPPGSDGGT